MRFRGIQNEATEKSKKALFSLLARGYQLRYYDANGKMLAVYANEIAWADVSEAENGAVTAEALTAAAPHCGRDRCGIPEQALCLLLQPRKPQP